MNEESVSCPCPHAITHKSALCNCMGGVRAMKNLLESNISNAKCRLMGNSMRARARNRFFIHDGYKIEASFSDFGDKGIFLKNGWVVIE